MGTQSTAGGFAGSPADAFTPPAAGSCCGSVPAHDATPNPVAGGCCGTDAAVPASTCCGDDAVTETAVPAATGCCG